jgi:hypothetical protein
VTWGRQTRTAGRKAGTSWCLLAGVAAVLVGILGMHAVTMHASGHASGHDMAMSGDTADVVAMPPMDVASVEDAAPAPGDEHGPGGMVMLCLYMLGVVVGALLLLLALRRGPRGSAVLGRLRTRARPAPDSLPGAGPPPVWSFSVIRC